MCAKICLNIKCKKDYNTTSEHDDGFCCFECWEQVNCKEPTIEIFEHNDFSKGFISH